MDQEIELTTKSAWLEKKERGSSWTIRLMVILCKFKYRWLVNLLLYPITAYFFITSGAGHKASKQFFIKATGQFSLIDHYRQLLCFAHSLVDRVSILMGESRQFKVIAQGREKLIQAKKVGRGTILLGAHLGNFEACKLLVKDRANLDVHIVAYFEGSQKIRKQLDAINPNNVNNIIDPSSPDAVFLMRDVIEKGGVLAILGDRIGIGDKKLPVDFLGEQTFLPAGPYFLASILQCPIYCFFGLRAAKQTYHSYTILLAEKVSLKRGQREQDAQVYAQQYADLLAEKAREYPHNWFNFFEYWKAPPNS